MPSTFQLPWLTLVCLVIGACHPAQALRSPAIAHEPLEVSDNCLIPEDGMYDPSPWRAREEKLRDQLLPADRAGIGLLAFSVRAFASARLVLVRQRSGTFTIEEYALAGKSAPDSGSPEGRDEPGVLSSHVKAIDEDLAVSLSALWTLHLERTQYAESRADIMIGKADGENYHYWQRGMAGHIASPRPRSLLDDLGKVVEAMASYASGSFGHAELKQTVEWALARAKSGGSCLMPSEAGESPD